jgi:hypothetical protein
MFGWLHKLYRNEAVHNIIGHPMAEIAFLITCLFNKGLAPVIWKRVHDFTRG